MEIITKEEAKRFMNYADSVLIDALKKPNICKAELGGILRKRILQEETKMRSKRWTEFIELWLCPEKRNRALKLLITYYRSRNSDIEISFEGREKWCINKLENWDRLKGLILYGRDIGEKEILLDIRKRTYDNDKVKLMAEKLEEFIESRRINEDLPDVLKKYVFPGYNVGTISRMTELYEWDRFLAIRAMIAYKYTRVGDVRMEVIKDVMLDFQDLDTFKHISKKIVQVL